MAAVDRRAEEDKTRLTRRSFTGLLLAGGVTSLAGCVDRQSPEGFAMETAPSRQLDFPIESYRLMYAGVKERSYWVPPVPYRWMNPDYLRQIVHDPTVEPKGTIVIDEQSHYLYLILGDRKALRYGIAFGSDYRRWPGRCDVRRRERWPAWYRPGPTTREDGSLTGRNHGQQPGLRSPYGSRAMYIYRGRTDTKLVIHGTAHWYVIGGPAPQGSIVMLNQDVMDLYHRTHTGTPVVIVSTPYPEKV